MRLHGFAFCSCFSCELGVLGFSGQRSDAENFREDGPPVQRGGYSFSVLARVSRRPITPLRMPSLRESQDVLLRSGRPTVVIGLCSDLGLLLPVSSDTQDFIGLSASSFTKDSGHSACLLSHKTLRKTQPQ